MIQKPLIDCRAITCCYGPAWMPGAAQAPGAALDGVCFAAEEGSWTTIVGPSGSGKTTLLRALAGLEPLAKGEIVLFGQTASNHRLALAPHERGVGMLFQEASLWPHLTAVGNVELALSDCAGGRLQRRAEALDWLARVNAADLASRLPGELSGGEARRVTLARALAARPRILLLDEPAAHLDIHRRGELLSLVRRLHGELGLTTLCVTHQLEPPLAPGERIVILEQGRITFDGRFDTLAAAPATPYTNALRRWIRRMEDWSE